ncbi:tetratricopeptide repeat protein [Paraburkholderia humisilvae]|uniref:Methyltransferase type 11 domain-containing protein n=1 Tax=Paraburkholderia humisilvae TaxID=627669 RepID=A0A6J5DE82_9BURK|nr:tetratricopeptide repeat protein [Paraburkholderia humisilvae]CAB3751126.1 hypothetical protein LMG29542_01419 [Paraburkholderia humisilvae]
MQNLSSHRKPTSARPALTITLQQAVQAHQAGQLDTAERLYRRVLTLRAAQPDALHYLGVLHHQRGQSDQAVELVSRSLRLTPGHADAHSNLGNIHKECGRLEEAEACYRRALHIAAAHPQALGNLAVVLEAQARDDDARSAYQQWLDRRPDEPRAHYQFGRFLCNHARAREDIEHAVERFRHAYRLDRGNVQALESLGVALYGLGSIDEAAQVYRDWASIDPRNPIPRHMLAACGTTDAPPRANDDYVRELFDGFAASFDEQLLKNLGYRAPQALVDALGDIGDSLDVLDAGCGTGLCGPLLRARSRTLVGVDLSEGMLERARLRGCYDELVSGELGVYLQAHTHAYDLILCADTLVYFGELDEVLALARRALRAGGRLVFSLEARLDTHEGGYALTPSGRYQHSRAYVQQCLAAAEFADVRIDAQALRKEAGEWVGGWAVLARCPL